MLRQWCSKDTLLPSTNQYELRTFGEFFMCAGVICESVCTTELRQYIQSHVAHTIFVVFTLQNFLNAPFERTTTREAIDTYTHSMVTSFLTQIVFPHALRIDQNFIRKIRGERRQCERARTNISFGQNFFFLLLFFRVRRESIFNFHRSGVVLVGLSQMAVESCCTSVRRCSSIDGGNFHYLC